jgi:uncharacterized metal-binding protein YceD (DUF177 family)
LQVVAVVVLDKVQAIRLAQVAHRLVVLVVHLALTLLAHRQRTLEAVAVAVVVDLEVKSLQAQLAVMVQAE